MTLIRFWLLLLLSVMTASVFASQIECAFDVNDIEKKLIIHPHNDIYQSSKIDLPGGFRFTGQYLQELKKFKAYIYHTPKSRYVLLALQEYGLSEKSCQQDFGRHRVYDSDDERELYFHCKRTCAQ